MVFIELICAKVYREKLECYALVRHWIPSNYFCRTLIRSQAFYNSTTHTAYNKLLQKALDYLYTHCPVVV